MVIVLQVRMNIKINSFEHTKVFAYAIGFRINFDLRKKKAPKLYFGDGLVNTYLQPERIREATLFLFNSWVKMLSYNSRHTNQNRVRGLTFVQTELKLKLKVHVRRWNYLCSVFRAICTLNLNQRSIYNKFDWRPFSLIFSLYLLINICTKNSAKLVDNWIYIRLVADSNSEKATQRIEYPNPKWWIGTL